MILHYIKWRKKKHQERPMNIFVTLKLSRFINAMLPSRLVLVVYVCVSVCGRADSTIQLIQSSSSSSAAAHHTTFKYSPLSHLLCQIVVCESRLCLIPSSFQSCAFFVPVRVPVDLSLWIRHVTSALLFTALVWPSKSLRHYPVSLWTAPIIISIGLIKRAYSHTVSAFPSWQKRCNFTPGMNRFTLHIRMNVYLFLYFVVSFECL